jgi:DNA-binding transcriptional MerR regulator
VSFAIPKDEVNMKRDEKRNFLYTLRTFCEMTITEASQAGGIPISSVHEYETEGVRLLPIRYLIAMKREANVSWETVGELMEKWNEERPLRKRPKTSRLVLKVEE